MSERTLSPVDRDPARPSGGTSHTQPGTLAPAARHHVLALQPAAKDAWIEFAAELETSLAALQEDEYLIVAIKRTNRFVQFSAQGAFGMRVEATSNFYLPERESLGEEEHAVLLALGWHPPTNLPDGLDLEGHKPDGSPNYFVDAAQPVPLDAIALLAVNTLVGVFGAEHPGSLEYTAFGEGGTSIRFPSLRIRCAAGN